MERRRRENIHMRHCHVLTAVLGAIALAGCGPQANQTPTPIISASGTVDAVSAPTLTTGPSLTAVATIALQRETLSPRSTRPNSTGDPAVLGVPFPIKDGQTVEVASEELAITFREVMEDLRCPVDVECFWAGQAVIDVEVAQQGISLGSFSLTLGQDDNAAQISASGYRITFVALDPIPDTRNSSPPDYVATLRVVLADE